MDAYSMLSQTLQQQSQSLINRHSNVLLEFGYIRDGYMLYIDRFGTAIPKGEYSVDNRLAFDYQDTEVTTSSSGSHSHTVKIPTPAGNGRIKNGDKVLVCWVGDEPIVVSVVVSSKDM